MSNDRSRFGVAQWPFNPADVIDTLHSDAFAEGLDPAFKWWIQPRRRGPVGCSTGDRCLALTTTLDLCVLIGPSILWIYGTTPTICRVQQTVYGTRLGGRLMTPQ